MEASLFNDPVAETVTALAGPLESIILAILLQAFSPFLNLPILTRDLARINLGLGIFNLLPLFPLDGGRILLSSLVRRYGYKKAMRSTTNWTRMVIFLAGPLLGWFALLKTIPPHLPILLFFLLVSTKQPNFLYSYLAQQTKKTTHLTEEGLLPSKVWVVDAKRKVGEILPFLTGRNYHLFFLIDKHGKILGEITEEQLIEMLSQDNMFNLNIEAIWGHGAERPNQAGGN